MKPLRLSFAGFASYKDEAQIDFSTFEQAGVYLICGKTGSGKTTIFDAICYALFEHASGSLRNTKMLRSQYMKPGEPSWVRLEFEYQGRVHEVYRRLTYLVPKQRGEGFTEKKAQLEFVRDKGTTHEKRFEAREAAEALSALLPFSFEQYKQLAMIAQGEFQRLLSVSSAEREEILRHLLDLSALERFYELLRKQSEAKQEELSQLLFELDRIVDRLHEEGLIEAADKDEAHLNLPGLIEKLQFLGAKFSNERKTELERVKSLKDRQRQGLARLGEQMKSLQRHLQLQADVLACFKTQQALWRAQEERFSRLMEEFPVKQEGLSGLKLELEEVYKLRREYDELEAEYRQQEKKIAHIFADKARAQKDCDELEAKQKKLQKQAEELADLGELHQQLRAQADAFRESDEQFVRVQRRFGEHEKLEESLRKHRAEYSKLQGELTLLEGVSLQFEEGLRSDMAYRLSLDLKLGEPCPVCGSKEHPHPAEPAQDVSDALIGVAEKALGTPATAKPDELLEKLKDLIDSKKRKQDGVRCESVKLGEQERGLCAQIEEQLETLALRYLTGGDDSGKLLQYPGSREDQAAYLGWLSERRDQVGAALQSYKARLDAQARELQEQEGRQLALKESLAYTQEQLEKLHSRLDGLKEETSHLEGRKEHQLEKLEMLHAMYKERVTKLQETPCLEVFTEKDLRAGIAQLANSKESSLQRGAALLSELLESTSQKLDVLLQEHEECREQKQCAEKEQAMYEAKFHTHAQELQVEAAALRETCRIQDELGLLCALKTSVPLETFSWKESLHEAAQEKSAPYDELIGALSLDREACEKSSQALSQAHEQALQEYQRFCEQKDMLSKSTQRLEGLAPQLSRVQEEARELQQLDSLSRGQYSGAEQLSFSRYVISFYFEKILEHACRRLELMTYGRFSLRRQAQSSDRRKSAGLDIEVFDTYTNTARPVQSLSGGESFKAALALALGMSDYLQQQAGGLKLEALFIDEGFGTLDPQSLEQAIELLDELAQGNRLVGLISHVAELKEHIGVGIQVEHGPQGSRLQVFN